MSLGEEAEIPASIFPPAEGAYLATVPQLTPEVVEELLDMSWLDGRKTIGLHCLHVDDLLSLELQIFWKGSGRR